MFKAIWVKLTKDEEGVPRVHEHEDSSEEIFVEDVVLDVVSVVLDAEGK